MLKCQNATRRTLNQVLLNTDYFTKWVTALVVGAYIFVGGREVIRGELSVGIFLTNLDIFWACGADFAAIYDTHVTMQRTLPSMMSIYHLLNLEIDAIQRMELDRFQIAP